MRIELTREILSPHLSDFLRNSTIHFPMNLYLVTCFMNVTVSRCYASQKLYRRYMCQFIPMLLVKGDEIVRACNRHSKDTATLRKRVTKYNNMQKWMI